MQLLSREFEWPSEASVTLHIPLSGSQNWANEKDSLAPRITETVWSSLSSHWQDRGFGHVTGYREYGTARFLRSDVDSNNAETISITVQPSLQPCKSVYRGSQARRALLSFQIQFRITFIQPRQPRSGAAQQSRRHPTQTLTRLLYSLLLLRRNIKLGANDLCLF